MFTVLIRVDNKILETGWRDNNCAKNSKQATITLMMDAASTSETPANFYQTTRYKIPEDCTFSANTVHQALREEM
jgi:hypothetical protein